MLSLLKNHPFAVEAFFDCSTVLTFAIPKEQLQHLLPPCLALDTYQDKWAFVAVAMVQTKGLRPKGFPKVMGNDFFLIGYRIFVTYINNKGKRLRGLYIIKSETDKSKMQVMGNIFTHYNYHKTDIQTERNKDHTRFTSVHSGLDIAYSHSQEAIELPSYSPFTDWKTARRFAGPLPFTFTYSPKKNKVLIIEGVRQHWQPQPIKVLQYKLDNLEPLIGKGAILASAFKVENIPYYWKKGKVEIWNR
ncbi:DUF2071 domain-containing protein [Limibacter armeniacum]|uniref:DUF2071 domain-containing protein n=1 Tax=Limibacter armeniacum TaxID=466084 RepID=UPI002FE683CA